LGSLLNDVGVDVTPASLGPAGTDEVTFVARFREKVTAVTATSASFAAASGGTNFVEIWFGPKNADDLAGTGFNDGTKIMSGTVVSDVSNFGVDTSVPPDQLDQFGTDNYPTIQTLTGNGSTILNGAVSVTDTTFFPLTPGT